MYRQLLNEALWCASSCCSIVSVFLTISTKSNGFCKQGTDDTPTSEFVKVSSGVETVSCHDICCGNISSTRSILVYKKCNWYVNRPWHRSQESGCAREWLSQLDGDRGGWDSSFAVCTSIFLFSCLGVSASVLHSKEGNLSSVTLTVAESILFQSFLKQNRSHQQSWVKLSINNYYSQPQSFLS